MQFYGYFFTFCIILQGKMVLQTTSWIRQVVHIWLCMGKKKIIERDGILKRLFRFWGLFRNKVLWAHWSVYYIFWGQRKVTYGLCWQVWLNNNRSQIEFELCWEHNGSAQYTCTISLTHGNTYMYFQTKMFVGQPSCIMQKIIATIPFLISTMDVNI